MMVKSPLNYASMKIYVSHSTNFDYKTELYEPLNRAFSDIHALVLPHEKSEDGVRAKDIIPTCDLLLAEVSYPSTGQGIELGWADVAETPIICFYKSGSKISGAINFIDAKSFEYQDISDMVSRLQAEIK